MSATDPVREAAPLTTCCCRLRIGDREAWDSCSQHTSGPDEPICRDCESAGHSKQENFDPTIKGRG